MHTAMHGPGGKAGLHDCGSIAAGLMRMLRANIALKKRKKKGGGGVYYPVIIHSVHLDSSSPGVCDLVSTMPRICVSKSKGYGFLFGFK